MATRKDLNKKLVEDLTSTDLGIITNTATPNNKPLGSQRSIRNKLKTRYRMGLENSRERMNRAVMGRMVG